MNNHDREAQAMAMYEAGKRRLKEVKSTHKWQKFPIGSRVFISEDMPPSMSHFFKERKATVVGTYAQTYSPCSEDKRDYQEYTLDIDGLGEVSWYPEHLLTLIEEVL